MRAPSEELVDMVAPRPGDRVLVIDVRKTRRRSGDYHTPYRAEQPAVFRRVALPRFLPFLQMAQLHTQHGCLNFIQSAVPALFRAYVSSGLPVIPLSARSRSPFFLI